MLRQEILKTYRKEKSIRKTVEKTGAPFETVRRILITEGLHTSPKIKRIRELTAAGMPPADIAELLQCSKSSVIANMPYPRGCRADWPETQNARRIRACRARKKKRDLKELEKSQDQ